jgi:hypothetical protein
MRLAPAKRLFVSILLAAAWLQPAMAQDELPDAPGRAETLKACSGCHDTETFTRIQRSPAQWDITVANMINWGATISDSDYDTVVAYLSTWFGLTPRPPVPAAQPPAPAP